tara:strand:+ start:194 stop:664 length:471 start_codon:yes stop_codon:yes gene_type:complete
MNWYLQALKKYATFEGRARRKEYWMFFLFWLLFYVLAVVVDVVVLGKGNLEIQPVSLVYSLATLLPFLAVAVRRLHDVGKSGWMVLIGFVPALAIQAYNLYALSMLTSGDTEVIQSLAFINLTLGLAALVGSIWLLILYCMDGSPGVNRYGPNPKG